MKFNGIDDDKKDFISYQQSRITVLPQQQKVTLLYKIFDATVKAKDTELQTSLLQIWKDLSITFPYDNLFSVLGYLIDTVDASRGLHNFETNIMPTVKNIFFAIYEPKQSRQLIIVYIVKILLNVLTMDNDKYTQSSLMKRNKAANILTTLESRLYKKDNNDEFNSLLR